MPWPLDDKPVGPVANALSGNVIGFPQGGKSDNALVMPKSTEFTVGGGYGGGTSAANTRKFHLTDSGGTQAYATFEASSPEDFRRQFSQAINQAQANRIPYLRNLDYRLALEVGGLPPYVQGGQPRTITDHVRTNGKIADPGSVVSVPPRFLSAEQANELWDHANKTAANILDFDRAVSGMSQFAAQQPKTADVVAMPSDRAIGSGILGDAVKGGSFKGSYRTNE